MMQKNTKMKIFFSTCFIFIFLIKSGHGAMEQYKWMYFEPYGSTVHLEPLFNNTQCTNQSRCYWLLPDKQTRLNYPWNENSESNYLLASNGTLTIFNIQASDNGIYHFFIWNNSQWIVSKSLLNLRGAPFDSLWLEYWPNVVGGLVAMAVVFITFGLIILADKYRYRSPSTFSTRRQSNRLGTVEPFNQPVIIQRSNPVFINDDNDTIGSQKRTSSRCSSNSNTTDLRIERL